MKRQRGFGAILAIVLLVLLAALASAIVSIGSTQQMSVAQDVLSARAWQAARAGNEWGLYQALHAGGSWNGAACTAASSTLDLTADTGFHVTVSCDSSLYNEGESAVGTPQTVRVYSIKAVACSATTCPKLDALASGVTYIERSRVVIATD